MMKEKQLSLPFIYQLAIGLILFIIAFSAAMVFGAADATVKDAWLALTSNTANDTVTLLREIRLPRELAAIFVGAALGVAGAMMQGMTRNPLADPGLLGLTAGANAALAIAIVFLPSANYLAIMLACMAGAAGGAALVLGLGSMKKGSLSPFRIVLAGAVVSAFLQAVSEGIGLYFHISKDVSMWTAGGLIGTSWEQLQIIAPFIAGGLFAALLLSRQLTILSLSEEAAAGLGQKTMQVKVMLFCLIVLLAGASVALVGNMTFIGLMVPHIVRAVTGSDYRFIIPMSALVGASFMLFADMLGRTINAPYETPVAAIVAIMGLPFFLLIVRKGGRTFS